MQRIQQKLISYVLDSILDVADVVPEDIQSSVYNGEVELKGVALRPAKLNKLIFGHNTPEEDVKATTAGSNNNNNTSEAKGGNIKQAFEIEILKGEADLLRISVPVLSLTTVEPIRAVLEGVTIVVGPKRKLHKLNRSRHHRRNPSQSSVNYSQSDNNSTGQGGAPSTSSSSSSSDDEGGNDNDEDVSDLFPSPVMLTRDQVIEALREELVLGIDDFSMHDQVHSLTKGPRDDADDGTTTTTRMLGRDDGNTRTRSVGGVGIIGLPEEVGNHSSDDVHSSSSDNNNNSGSSSNGSIKNNNESGDSNGDSDAVAKGGDEQQQSSDSSDFASVESDSDNHTTATSKNTNKHANTDDVDASAAGGGWFDYLKSTAVSMVPAAWKAPRTYIIELRNITVVMDCTPPSTSTTTSTQQQQQQQSQSLVATISSATITINPSVVSESPSSKTLQKGLPQEETSKITNIDIGEINVSAVHSGKDTTTGKATKMTTHVLVIPPTGVISKVVEVTPKDLSTLNNKGHLIKTTKQEVTIDQPNVWQLRIDTFTLGIVRSCLLGMLGEPDKPTNKATTSSPSASKNITATIKDSIAPKKGDGASSSSGEKASSSRHSRRIKRLWRRCYRLALLYSKDRKKRSDLSLSYIKEVRNTRDQYIRLLRALMAPGGRTKFGAYRDELAMLEMEIKYRDVVFALRRMIHIESGTVAMLENAITVSRTSDYISKMKSSDAAIAETAVSTGRPGTYLSTISLPMVVRANMAGFVVDCPGGYVLQVLTLRILSIHGVSVRFSLGFIGLRCAPPSNLPAVEDGFPRTTPLAIKGQGPLLIFSGSPPTIASTDLLSSSSGSLSASSTSPTTTATSTPPVCISFTQVLEGPFSAPSGNNNFNSNSQPQSDRPTPIASPTAAGASSTTTATTTTGKKQSTLRFEEPVRDDTTGTGGGGRAQRRGGRNQGTTSGSGTVSANAAYYSTISAEVAPITINLKSTDVITVVRPIVDCLVSVQVAVRRLYHIQARIASRFDKTSTALIDPKIGGAGDARAFAKSRLKNLQERNAALKQEAQDTARATTDGDSPTSLISHGGGGKLFVVEVLKLEISVAPITLTLDSLCLKVQSLQFVRITSSGSAGMLISVYATKLLFSVEGKQLVEVPTVKADLQRNLIVIPSVAISSSDATINTITSITTQIKTVMSAVDAISNVIVDVAAQEGDVAGTTKTRNNHLRDASDDEFGFHDGSDYGGGGGGSMSAYSADSRSIAPSMDFSASPSTASNLNSRKALRQSLLTKKIKAAVFDVLNRSLKAKKNVIEGLSLIPSLSAYHRHNACRRPTGFQINSLQIKHDTIVDVTLSNMHVGFTQRTDRHYYDPTVGRVRKSSEPSTNIAIEHGTFLLFGNSTKIDLTRFWLEITSTPGAVTAAPVIQLLVDGADVYICKMGDATTTTSTPTTSTPPSPSSSTTPSRVALYGDFPDTPLASVECIRMAACARHTDFMADKVDLCGGGVVVRRVGLNITPRPGVTVVDTRPTVASDLEANVSLSSIDLRKVSASYFEAVPVVVSQHAVPLAKRIMTPLAIRLFMSSLTNIVLTIMEGKSPITSFNGFVAVVEIMSTPAVVDTDTAQQQRQSGTSTNQRGDNDHHTTVDNEDDDDADDRLSAKISRGQQRLTMAALGAVASSSSTIGVGGGAGGIYTTAAEPTTREWSPQSFIGGLPGMAGGVAPQLLLRQRRNFYQGSTMSGIRPYNTRSGGGSASESVLHHTGGSSGSSDDDGGGGGGSKSTNGGKSHTSRKSATQFNTVKNGAYPLFNLLGGSRLGSSRNMRRHQQQLLGGGGGARDRFTLSVVNDADRMMSQLLVENVVLYISPFTASASPNHQSNKCRVLVEVPKFERSKPLPREDYWTTCPPTLSHSVTMACPSVNVCLSRSSTSTTSTNAGSLSSTVGGADHSSSPRRQSPGAAAAVDSPVPRRGSPQEGRSANGSFTTTGANSAASPVQPVSKFTSSYATTRSSAAPNQHQSPPATIDVNDTSSSIASSSSLSSKNRLLLVVGASHVVFETSSTDVPLSSYYDANGSEGVPFPTSSPSPSSPIARTPHTGSGFPTTSTPPTVDTNQNSLKATSSITRRNGGGGGVTAAPSLSGSSSSDNDDHLSMNADNDDSIEALEQLREGGGDDDGSATAAASAAGAAGNSLSQQLLQLRRAKEDTKDISVGSLSVNWGISTGDDWFAAKDCIEGIVAVFADRRQHEVICPLGRFVCTNCVETTSVSELKSTTSPSNNTSSSTSTSQPTVVISEEVFDFTKTMLEVVAMPESEYQRAVIVSARDRELTSIAHTIREASSSSNQHHMIHQPGGSIHTPQSSSTNPTPPTTAMMTPVSPSQTTSPFPSHPTPITIPLPQPPQKPVMFIFDKCIFIEDPTFDNLLSLKVGSNTVVLFRECTFAVPGCTKQSLKKSLQEPHGTSIVAFEECNWMVHNPLAALSSKERKGQETLYKAVSKSEMFKQYSTSDLQNLDDTDAMTPSSIRSPLSTSTIAPDNVRKSSTVGGGEKPKTSKPVAQTQECSADGCMWGIERSLFQLQLMKSRFMITLSSKTRNGVVLETGSIAFKSDAVTARKSVNGGRSVVSTTTTPPFSAQHSHAGSPHNTLNAQALQNQRYLESTSNSRFMFSGAASPNSTAILSDRGSYGALECVRVTTVTTDTFNITEGISLRCSTADGSDVRVLPKGTANITCQRKWDVSRRAEITQHLSTSGTDDVMVVMLSNASEPQTSLSGSVCLDPMTLPLSMLDTVTDFAATLSSPSSRSSSVTDQSSHNNNSADVWSTGYLPEGAQLRPHTADTDVMSKQLSTTSITRDGKTSFDPLHHANKTTSTTGGFWMPTSDDLWLGRSKLRRRREEADSAEKSSAAFAREMDNTSGSRKMLSLIPSFHNLGRLTVIVTVPSVGVTVVLPTGCPLASVELAHIRLESGGVSSPNDSMKAAASTAAVSASRSPQAPASPTSATHSVSDWATTSSTNHLRPQQGGGVVAASQVVKVTATTRLVVKLYDMCRKSWNAIVEPTPFTFTLVRTESRATVALHLSSLNVKLPSAALRTITFAMAFLGQHREIGQQRLKELNKIEEHLHTTTPTPTPNNTNGGQDTSENNDTVAEVLQPRRTLSSPLHALHNETGVPIDVYFADGQSVSLGVGATLTRLDPFTARVESISAAALPKVKVSQFHTVTLSRYSQNAGYASLPIVAPTGMTVEELQIPTVFSNEDADVLFAEQSITYVGDAMELRIERVFDSSFSEVIRIRSCFIVENHTASHFVLSSTKSLTSASTKQLPSSTATSNVTNVTAVSDGPPTSPATPLSPSGTTTAPTSPTATPPTSTTPGPPVRVIIGPHCRMSLPVWLLDDPFVSLQVAVDGKTTEALKSALKATTPSCAGGGTTAFLTNALSFNSSLRSLCQHVIDRDFASLHRTTVLNFPTPSQPTTKSTTATTSKVFSLVLGVTKATHTGVLHLHHACGGVHNATRCPINTVFLKGADPKRDDYSGNNGGGVGGWLSAASTSGQLFAPVAGLPNSSRHIVSTQSASPQQIGWINLNDPKPWLQKDLKEDDGASSSSNQKSSSSTSSSQTKSWEVASTLVVIEMETPRGVYSSDPICLNTAAMMNLQSNITTCSLRLRTPANSIGKATSNSQKLGGNHGRSPSSSPSRATTTLSDMADSNSLYSKNSSNNNNRQVSAPSSSSLVGSIFSTIFGGPDTSSPSPYKQQQLDTLKPSVSGAGRRSDVLSMHDDDDDGDDVNTLTYPDSWSSPHSITSEDVILVNLVAGTHGSLPIIHVTPHEDYTYIINRSGTPLQLISIDSGMNSDLRRNNNTSASSPASSSSMFNYGSDVDDGMSGGDGGGYVVPGIGDSAIPAGGTVYVPAGRYRLRPPGGYEATKDIGFVDSIDLSIVDTSPLQNKHKAFLRQSFIIQKQPAQKQHTRQLSPIYSPAEASLFGASSSGAPCKKNVVSASTAKSLTGWAAYGNCPHTALQSEFNCRLHGLSAFPQCAIEILPVFLITNSDPIRHLIVEHRARTATSNFATGSNVSVVSPGEMHAVTLKADQSKLDEFRFGFASPSSDLSTPSSTTALDAKTTMLVNGAPYTLHTHLSEYVCVRDYRKDDYSMIPLQLPCMNGGASSASMFTTLRLVFPVIAGPMEMFIDPLVVLSTPSLSSSSPRAPLTLVNLSSTSFDECSSHTITYHSLCPLTSRVVLQRTTTASSAVGGNHGDDDVSVLTSFQIGFVDSSGPFLLQDVTDTMAAAADALLLGMVSGGSAAGGNHASVNADIHQAANQLLIGGNTPLKTPSTRNGEGAEFVDDGVLASLPPRRVMCSIKAFDCPDYGRRFVAILSDEAPGGGGHSTIDILFKGKLPSSSSMMVHTGDDVGQLDSSTPHSSRHPSSFSPPQHHNRSSSTIASMGVHDDGASSTGRNTATSATSLTPGGGRSASAAARAEVQSLRITFTADDTSITLLDSTYSSSLTGNHNNTKKKATTTTTPSKKKSTSATSSSTTSPAVPGSGVESVSDDTGNDANDCGDEPHAMDEGLEVMVPLLKVVVGSLYCSTRFRREPGGGGSHHHHRTASSSTTASSHVVQPPASYHQPQWGASNVPPPATTPPPPPKSVSPTPSHTRTSPATVTSSRIELNIERLYVLDLTGGAEISPSQQHQNTSKGQKPTTTTNPMILQPASIGVVYTGSDPLVEYSQLNASAITCNVSPLTLAVSDLLIASVMSYADHSSWSGSGSSKRERQHEERLRQCTEVLNHTHQVLLASQQRSHQHIGGLVPVQVALFKHNDDINTDTQALLFPRVPRPVRSDGQIKYLSADSLQLSEIKLTASWRRSHEVDVLAGIPVLSAILQSVEDAKLVLPPFERRNLRRKPIGELATAIQESYRSTILRQWTSILGGLKIFGISTITAGVGHIGSSLYGLLTSSSSGGTSTTSPVANAVGQPVSTVGGFAGRLLGSWMGMGSTPAPPSSFDTTAQQQQPPLDDQSAAPTSPIKKDNDPPMPVGHHSWLCFSCKAIRARAASEAAAQSSHPGQQSSAELRAELSDLLLNYGPSALAHHASMQQCLLLLQVEPLQVAPFVEVDTTLTTTSSSSPRSTTPAVKSSSSNNVTSHLVMGDRQDFSDTVQTICENGVLIATREYRASRRPPTHSLNNRTATTPSSRPNSLLQFAATNLHMRVANTSELELARVGAHNDTTNINTKKSSRNQHHWSYTNTVITLMILHLHKEVDRVFLGDVLANQDGEHAVSAQSITTLLASSEDHTSHLINPHVSARLYEKAFQRVMSVGVAAALKRTTAPSSSSSSPPSPTVAATPQLSLAHRVAKRWMDNLQSSPSSSSLQAATPSNSTTAAPVVAVPSVSVLRGLGLVRSNNHTSIASTDTPQPSSPINSSGGDAIAAASMLLGLPTPDALFNAGMPPSAVYTIFLTSARKTQRRIHKLITAESASPSTILAASSSTSRKSGSGGVGRTSPSSLQSGQVIATVNMRISWAVQRALSIWEGYYIGCILSSVLVVDDPLTLFLRRNSWGLPGGEGSSGGSILEGAGGYSQQQQHGDQTVTYRSLPLVRE